MNGAKCRVYLRARSKERPSPIGDSAPGMAQIFARGEFWVKAKVECVSPIVAKESIHCHCNFFDAFGLGDSLSEHSNLAKLYDVLSSSKYSLAFLAFAESHGSS